MLPKLLIAIILIVITGCYEVLPDTYTTQQLTGTWNLVSENWGIDKQNQHPYYGVSVSIKFNSSSSYERKVGITKVEEGKYETSSMFNTHTGQMEPSIKFSGSGDTFLYKISNDSLYLDDNKYTGYLRVYVKSWLP